MIKEKEKFDSWFRIYVQVFHPDYPTAAHRCLHHTHCFVCNTLELNLMKPNIHSIDLLEDVRNVWMCGHNLKKKIIICFAIYRDFPMGWWSSC